MKNKYHILNGYSLKNQFPKDITGEKIIARLCLVDGDVKGNSLNQLFKTRAKFISKNYNDFTKKDYYDITAIEIQKINKIGKDAEINLWFEDDLFCQVNFWFIINLITKVCKSNNIFLIRPRNNNKYSFGSMNETALKNAFYKKIKIEVPEMKELSKLWNLYQLNNCNEMLYIAKNLKTKFNFLIPAINAQKERHQSNKNIDRPTQSLIKIMSELKTRKFSLVFSAFCKKEAIYGFGDLQVKRIFDEIIKKSIN